MFIFYQKNLKKASNIISIPDSHDKSILLFSTNFNPMKEPLIIERNPIIRENKIDSK